MKPQIIFSSNYEKQSHEGAFNMKFMQGYFQKKVDDYHYFIKSLFISHVVYVEKSINTLNLQGFL